MTLEELIQFHKAAFEKTRNWVYEPEKQNVNRFHELAVELLESLQSNK